MILLQVDMLPPTSSNWPAWAIGTVATIGALTYLAKVILELWWTKGSEAEIKRMEAAAKLKDAEAKLHEAEAKLRAVDAEELAAVYEEKVTALQEQYEQKIKDLYVDYEMRAGKMQAHIDLVDKKLDASEERHTECIGKYNLLLGKVQILEQIAGIPTTMPPMLPKEIVKEVVQSANKIIDDVSTSAKEG